MRILFSLVLLYQRYSHGHINVCNILNALLCTSGSYWSHTDQWLLTDKDWVLDKYFQVYNYLFERYLVVWDLYHLLKCKFLFLFQFLSFIVGKISNFISNVFGLMRKLLQIKVESLHLIFATPVISPTHFKAFNSVFFW